MVTCANALTIIPAIDTLQFAEPIYIDNFVNCPSSLSIGSCNCYFRSRIFDKLAEDIAIYKTMRCANPLAMKRNRQTFTAGAFRASVEALQHCRSWRNGCRDTFVCCLFRWYPRAALGSGAMAWHSLNSSGTFTNKNFQYWLSLLFTPLLRYHHQLVLSVSATMLSNSQRLALEDYHGLSCMLQINRRNTLVYVITVVYQATVVYKLMLVY